VEVEEGLDSLALALASRLVFQFVDAFRVGVSASRSVSFEADMMSR
jgi:hypothetical protein